MPFTNAAIYFRTEATKISVTPDPADLPAAQIIHFNTANLRLEAIQEVEQNNIVGTPSPNAGGQRRFVPVDNGTLPNPITITGLMHISETANILKLKGFRRRLQKEAKPNTHIYGIFGINWPRVPALNVDPDGIIGLAIQKLQWNWTAPENFIPFVITIQKYGDNI